VRVEGMKVVGVTVEGMKVGVRVEGMKVVAATGVVEEAKVEEEKELVEGAMEEEVRVVEHPLALQDC